MKILTKIKHQTFSPKELFKLGVSRYSFDKWVKDGVIEKISWGMYKLANAKLKADEQLVCALAKAGEPSCICLLSALEYYHLTDYITNRVWVMVPESKRLADKGIRAFRTKVPNWNIGIVKEDGIRITSIERTLVDSLIYKHILGTDIVYSAIKTALQQKKTTLNKIAEVAMSLNVYKRIAPLLEILQ